MSPAHGDGEVRVGLQAYADACVTVVGDARMQVAVLSHDLDARVFGSAAFVDAARSFCLAHAHAVLRILVRHPALAMRDANRLVELGRRLPSRIQFRQPDEQDHAVVEELVIADERSLLCRERHDQMETTLLRHAPLDARLKLKFFNELWERAQPAREFSELKI